MKKPLGILLLSMLIAACVYQNEEELYPENGQACDTAGVTFSKTVLPVLQANCFVCHSASEHVASGGSLNLEDFPMLRSLAVNGHLYGSITHNPLFIPMPKNRAKLDSCSIAKIKAWIDKGAPDN